MNRVTSLAWLASMAAGGVAAAACGGDVSFQGSESTSSATSGSGGNTSSSSGNTSSSGTGGNEPMCGDGAPLAAACLQAPFFPWAPQKGFISGTVSGLTTPSTNCFMPPSGDGSSISVPLYPSDPIVASAVWFTIDTPEGQFIAGVSVKGFTADMLVVGAPLTVAFENNHGGGIDNPALLLEFWTEEPNAKTPLVLVGSNAAQSVGIKPGEESCHREDQICGYGDHDMLVSFAGELAVIGRHETANLGGLLVTNDRYTQLYDLGACNFADPIDYRYYGVRANAP